MFGSVIAYLRRQIGLRTDTKSSTGSLHSKLAHLIADVIGDLADVRADNTVMGWLASPVKSVQRGTTTVDDSSVTQSISAVVMAKSVLIITGWKSSVSGEATAEMAAEQSNVGALLTSTTQITFYLTGDSGSNVVAWQVIEFY
jgi:hypothetical protein